MKLKPHAALAVAAIALAASPVSPAPSAQSPLSSQPTGFLWGYWFTEPGCAGDGYGYTDPNAIPSYARSATFLSYGCQDIY